MPILVDRIALALQGLAWEIIVVDDDSPDDTSSIARAIARADRRVRIITRIGRRGLASACVEGMLASPAPYVAVMDADLQHDENLLRPMFDLLREDRADCVVGSRYRDSVQIAAFGAGRARASRIATAIAQRFTRANLTDPMSGFFMIKYDLVLPLIPSLSAVGFKIFLDIVLTAPASMRVAELPYDFRAREAGESKFDLKAAYDFIYLIVDKTLGRFMPARFIVFAVIGSIGVFVHLAALWLIFVVRQNDFAISQLIATVVAMTTNFLLNNELTFRDRRLRGRALLRGWVSFAAALLGWGGRERWRRRTTLRRQSCLVARRPGRDRHRRRMELRRDQLLHLGQAVTSQLETRTGVDDLYSYAIQIKASSTTLA